MRACVRSVVLLLAVIGLAGLTTPGLGGGKKLVTEVTVLTAAGKPAEAKRVVLESTGGKGSFTDLAITNAKGVAAVKHTRAGTVKVYVDGDHSTHGTVGVVPGKITVHLGHPRPYFAIDAYALQAPPAAEQSVDTLAKYLMEPATSDLDKVRAIFRWITDRVAYDIESLLSGTRGDDSPEGVLKNRKCVCQGYAQLFVALARKMDLDVVFVPGIAKGFTPSLDKDAEPKHAWNAVKIDGAWKLFDSTWGAGTVKDKQFTKKTNELYFNASPDVMVYTHFPDDPKWQMRPIPLTLEQFRELPRVPRELFFRGFSPERVWRKVKDESVTQFCTFYSHPGREVMFHDGPMEKLLKAGTKYHFYLEAADFPVLLFDNNGQLVPLQKRGPLFEAVIAPRRGTLILMGSAQTAGGTRHGIAKYEVD